MRTLYRLALPAAVVVVLILIYSPLGVLYVIGGVVCAAILVFSSVPKTDDDRERKESLFPSTVIYTKISSAWLGAKMDEAEEMRRKAENKPR
jgi:hypothetical protein